MTQVDTIHAAMDAVIQSLNTIGVNQTALKEQQGFTLEQHLRVNRTMGFHIPRQKGGTSWLALQFAREPQAYMLVHPNVKKMIIANYNAFGENRYTKRTAGPDLSSEQKRRLLTTDQLGVFNEDTPKVNGPIKLFIVDDSGVLFDKVRINKFYSWLAACEGVDVNTLILRMN